MAETNSDLTAPVGRSDAGFTLIEILVVLVLLGTIITAILGATRLNIQASHTARMAARTEAVLVNVADRLNRAPKSCDYTIYAHAAVLTEQWPIDQVSVEHWHYDYSKYAADPTAAGQWKPGACDAALSAPPALLVQRIRVNVFSPNGEISRFIEVVKSDV